MSYSGTSTQSSIQVVVGTSEPIKTKLKKKKGIHKMYLQLDLSLNEASAEGEGEFAHPRENL